MQGKQIWGMEYRDVSLKDALARTDIFLETASMNTILYLTASSRAGIREGGEIRRKTEAMDLLLCGDLNAMWAAGMQALNRLYEVEHMVFLQEFLRRLAHGKQRIFLLADTAEAVEQLREGLEKFGQQLDVAETGVVEPEIPGYEYLLNRINETAPDVVISRLSPEVQVRMMAEAKLMANASVWLGLTTDMLAVGMAASMRKRIVNFVRKSWFGLLFCKKKDRT